MNSNTNTKTRSSKRKCIKGLSPPPSGEKNSGLNPILLLVKLAKDLDTDEETVSIKVHINDTVFKDKNKNYETNSFNVIKTFGYNGIAVVNIIRALDLDISTP